MTDPDAAFMQEALQQAGEAAAAGEIPVGALVVAGGQTIAAGQNRSIRDNDPSAHAEIVALRAAGNALGNHRLTGATLYVTLEPCAQCCGALVLARVSRVVYGAADPKAGMGGSLGNILQDSRLNHRVSLTTGVLGEEAGRLLRDFFRARRK